MGMEITFSPKASTHLVQRYAHAPAHSAQACHKVPIGYNLFVLTYLGIQRQHDACQCISRHHFVSDMARGSFSGVRFHSLSVLHTSGRYDIRQIADSSMTKLN